MINQDNDKINVNNTIVVFPLLKNDNVKIEISENIGEVIKKDETVHFF